MQIDSSLSHVFLQEQENLSRTNVYTRPDPLITPPPSQQDLERIEETKRTAPQDVVQFNGIEIDLETYNDNSQEEEEGLDIRNTTPREMSDISLDLYIDGSLTYDEYSMLAFQPELHPRFEATVGALTGQRADPDRPRDYIAEWEEKYDFERRYPSGNEKTLKQIDRILGVLQGFQRSLDFVA